MGTIEESNGFEGLDDPARERGGVILLFWREEDAGGGVGKDVRAFFEVSVLHYVIF